MSAVVAVLAVVVAVLGLLVIGLLRSHAEILKALHDAGINLDPTKDHDHDHTPRRSATREFEPIRTRPGVPEPAGVSGVRAADISGRTPTGATRGVAVTDTDHATLLAFLTTGCATCAEFWSAFAEGVDLPTETRLVVVTKGPELESPADVAALAPPGVLTIASTEAWDDYSIPVAPYFALVDGRRGVVVGEGAAATWDRVRTLLDTALADSGYVPGQVSRRNLLSGRARHQRVDDDLRAAGFVPGDPRLHHESLPVADDGAVDRDAS